ncbi:LysR family transcriptional regulator [Lachnospiraceae bacterium 54-53]
MNTKDLKSFRAVYEEPSINQAAKKLFITPQGLSRNIRALETELYTVLFERTRQGVKPTESACLLYGRAEGLVRQLKAVENGNRQLKNKGIVLRIGCACGVFNVLPFRLVQRFTEENSRIRVEWNDGNPWSAWMTYLYYINMVHIYINCTDCSNRACLKSKKIGITT